MSADVPQPSAQLPPRQHLVAAGKWPLVGERAPNAWGHAHQAATSWQLSVGGLVRHPRTWSLAELQRQAAAPQELSGPQSSPDSLPGVERQVDIHCVTRWSKLNVRFRGVLLSDLLKLVQPLDSARFVSFVAASARDHSTSLPLADCRELAVLLAWEVEGEPIPLEHGGPLRVITPGRYFYKSLKWLRHVELLADDRLGFWEAEAGYHNRADPWQEERYLAPTVDKREAERLLAARNFSERDLRSLQAECRALAGLYARQALLRDANFRQADLRQAVFDGANLSNAHFEQADLRGASFRGADLEGANLEGADLRGADLQLASLFGATFVDPAAPAAAAQLDQTTQLSATALEQLLPAQAAYVAARATLLPA